MEHLQKQGAHVMLEQFMHLLIDYNIVCVY